VAFQLETAGPIRVVQPLSHFVWVRKFCCHET